MDSNRDLGEINIILFFLTTSLIRYSNIIILYTRFPLGKNNGSESELKKKRCS
jgi:hypothetical protein